MYLKKLNKWKLNRISDSCPEEVGRISEELGVTLPTARLLVNRGCMSAEDARRFIGKEEAQLYDPMLMRDMKTASRRVADAVEAQERIVIYGDYDVDGVTSVASLYLYLKSLGADVSYHIPCRMTEGYGMSSGVIEQLVRDGCELIITVDTGITATAEIAYAEQLGMDVVVTDHHECHAELPKAVAVVNPRRPDCTYPFKELAGVGVVFKLMCAIEMTLNPDDEPVSCIRRISREYCDLVALGTIADVMPVKDENRLIVSFGLSLIEKGSRPAVTELINASTSESKYNTKKKITAAYVGFTLAPRINAAGRIKSASTAVELFLSENPEDIKRFARELCLINKQRQQEENRMVEEAYAKIAAEHDLENERVLVIDDEKWHHGIIGIVASRITEKYGLPSILISFDGNGDGAPSAEDAGKGSGRSIKGVNLVEALKSCSDVLEKYGGHELAAGLTVKRGKLEEFKKRINDYVGEHTDSGDCETVLEAECELTPADMTMRLAEELYYLEPYGTSNPVPLFMANEMYVNEVIPIGGGKHTKLILRRENMIIVAMCFRMTPSELDLYPGDVVDVLFNLDINEFQGARTLQMIVRDIRLTSKTLEKQMREHEIFNCLRSGNSITLTDSERAASLPCRDEFATVYKLLRRELRVEHEVFSIRALGHLLSTCGYVIPYVKLKFIILIFAELRFFNIEETDAEREIYSFADIYNKEKTSLDSSSIFRALKKMLASEGTSENLM